MVFDYWILHGDDPMVGQPVVWSNAGSVSTATTDSSVTLSGWLADYGSYCVPYANGQLY